MVAVEWATRHPRECLGAVLINTSSRTFCAWHERLRPRSLPRLLAILRARTAPERERLVLALTSRHPGEPVDPLVDRWAAWRTEAPVSAANERRQLSAALRFRAPRHKPRVPVLVLASLGDGLVDPACSWRMAKAWGVELRLHASAGHDLPLDDPEWVARQAADWIARTASP
jgi:pimeloyl-ACP methyl ester carboxylesterase